MGYDAFGGLGRARGSIVVGPRGCNTRDRGLTRLRAFLPHRGLYNVKILVLGFVLCSEVNETRSE